MSGILETLKFLGSSWLEVAVAVDKRLETQAARIAALEAALRNIEADCCSDCPPSHGAIKYACRDALGGGKDE